MNKQRRKDFDRVARYLREGNTADAFADLEAIRDEEQEVLDSAAENFPGSERVEQMQEAVVTLDEAIAYVEAMEEAMGGALNLIERAQE